MMTKILRFALVFMLVLALLPVTGVSAWAGPVVNGKPTPTPTPTPINLTPPWTDPYTLPVDQRPAGLSRCQRGWDANNSEMLFCSPQPNYPVSGSPWTSTLVVFAHGYVNPYFPAGHIPWDQMSFPGADGLPKYVFDLVNEQGYFFATTSYRANGLVVQDALSDVNTLINWALPKMSYALLGKQVIVVGVSEGGLVTALYTEKYGGAQSQLKGGLAMCGPIGSFQKQVNYWGDLRALYDVYYPTLRQMYGGDAVNISNSLITDWYTNTAVRDSYNNLLTADLNKAVDLLRITGAPFGPTTGVPGVLPPDIQDPANILATFNGLLEYNVYATENGKQVLGGSPFSNKSVTYPSSNYFNNINNLVQRYTASRTALRNLPKYETTGTFSIPLVVLHNTGDPIVPYWHATLYQAKVTSPSRFQLRTSASYGHCNFTQQEILDAFNALGGMISPFSLQEAQSKLTPEQYAEYQEFLENSGQLPVDSGQ